MASRKEWRAPRKGHDFALAKAGTLLGRYNAKETVATVCDGEWGGSRKGHDVAFATAGTLLEPHEQ